jgi:hypothetical protein
MNFPDQEVWELEHSCMLDVAEMCGTTLQECADMMNVTRERVRQIEVSAIKKLEEMAEVKALQECSEGGPLSRRTFKTEYHHEMDIEEAACEFRKVPALGHLR